MADETLQELTAALAEEETGHEEEDLLVEDPDETTETTEETEDTEEGKETKETEEEEEETLPEEGKGFIGNVKKAYPDIFKKFPHLQHSFFRAKEYSEIFPSVEDAKEAAETLEGFKQLEGFLTSGKPEDTLNLLNSFKETGEESLKDFANNFLGSVRKIDQDLYYQVVTPELVNFTRSMYDAGLRSENDNLKNAALMAALHFFGDSKVASGEKKLELPTGKGTRKEDDSLKREREDFRRERYTTFHNETMSGINSKINTLIMNGIDPKEEMSEGMKSMIAEKVQKEVDRILGKSNSHVSKMNSLWRKANSDNFARIHQAKIISAYIEAAKLIMPKVRSKVRASIIGTSGRSTTRQSETTQRHVEPRRTVRSSTPSSSSPSSRQVTGYKGDGKDIDWSKTKDTDFLKDKVTLKNK